MKQVDPLPIHELIHRLVSQSPHQHKIVEASIINAWHQHMPTIVSRRTKRIYIKQNKIFVEIMSSPLRHELQNAKQPILDKLQKNVPGYTINDIVFIA